MEKFKCKYTLKSCIKSHGLEKPDCTECEVYKNSSHPEDAYKSDMVNHPPHYTAGKFECIDVIKDVLSFHEDAVSGWLTGQIIKYIWRWPLKNGVEDLKKTRFYLDKLIAYEESKNEKDANNGDLSTKSWILRKTANIEEQFIEKANEK